MSFKILHEKDWTYKLVKEQNSEKYFLEVVCGGVGMFELIIQLTPDEVAKFLEGGEAYISSLALEISQNHTAYMNRKVEIELA